MSTTTINPALARIVHHPVGSRVIIDKTGMSNIRNWCYSVVGSCNPAYADQLRAEVFNKQTIGIVTHEFLPGYELTVRFGKQHYSIKCDWIIQAPKHEPIISTMTIEHAKKLTERRKEDRIEMADHIAKLARESGVEVVIAAPCWDEKDIHVNITARHGLCVSVEFGHRSCQPDVYVLSWHFNNQGEVRLSTLFGDVNRCHFRKSTQVAHGFVGLCQTLSSSLAMIQDGSAFSDLPR